MSYQSGTMGIAEGMALVFILVFPRIFLTTPIQLIQESAGLGWLAAFFGGFICMGVALALNYATRHTEGDLLAAVKKYLGTFGFYLTGLTYAVIFFVNYILLVRQFAENTLLTALPNIEFSVIIALYAAVAAALVYLGGIEPVARGTYLLWPFSVAGLVIVLALLAPEYNVYNLAPWQGNGLLQFARDSVIFGDFNVGVLSILILGSAFHNYHTKAKAIVFGLGISALLRSLSIMVFTMVFGVETGREKVLPFFEMARLVYISIFLQRIEALFIILWVIIGIFSIAASLHTGLYLLTRMLTLPAMRPLIPAVTLILMQIAMLPGDITSVIQADIMMTKTLFAAGIYGLPAIIILAAVIKGKRKRKPCLPAS
ncbi:hypothetical protein SCACP_33300 [Sporomusa carbonis]|uniref:GerAB/ArcD/ProY family transporter n=1 Tax=Sporomusa carbonis TaxID=3076075 RepID=UPI003A5D6F0D